MAEAQALPNASINDPLTQARRIPFPNHIVELNEHSIVLPSPNRGERSRTSMQSLREMTE